MEFAEASRFIEELLQDWGQALARQAFRLTGDTEISDDLVQEAFLALYQELRRGADIENARAWTLTVVRNLAAKRYRSLGTRNECLEPSDVLDQFPASASTHPDQERELRDMLGILSHREQEVMLLRLDCLKYREIAECLGIDESSVATHLARAIRKLQAAAKERASHLSYARAAHAEKAL